MLNFVLLTITSFVSTKSYQIISKGGCVPRKLVVRTYMQISYGHTIDEDVVHNHTAATDALMAISYIF